MQLSKPILLVLLAACLPFARAAETCTTQSQMQPAERDALAAAASRLATLVQANDQPALRAATIAEYRKDFSGIGDLAAATSTHLKSATPEVEQVYILDASTLQNSASGAPPDAQFYCNLNKTAAEADFTIPQLPPGKYAFAMVRMESPSPYRLSFLLRSEAGAWQLAGFYPKPLTAGGHDGLWYWTEARSLLKQAQPWNAWLYLQEAQQLSQPAGFVSSTHLDKLQAEISSTAPPAIAAGIGPDTPLTIKAADGNEYRFTALSVDDSLGTERIDVSAHIKVDSLGEPAAARARNLLAMAALVDAHPELRKAFHGVIVFAEAPGAQPYGTEQAMIEIH